MKLRGFLDYSAKAQIKPDKTRDWGLLEFVKNGDATAFPKFDAGTADDASCFVDLMAALNPVYRQGAVFTMNRKIEWISAVRARCRTTR